MSCTPHCTQVKELIEDAWREGYASGTETDLTEGHPEWKAVLEERTSE